MKGPLGFALLGLVSLAVGASWVAQLIGDITPEAGGHGAWYASRAAGITSYLCLWASLVVGLLMSSAWFDGIVSRGRLLAMHQVLAFTGLAFGLAHALVLIPDGFTRFTPLHLFVPFASYSEPVLAGLGTIALYLFAIVTFSFWFRTMIGIRTWRWIHYASLVAFAAALWHGLRLGTDTSEPWMAAIYIASLSVLAGVATMRFTYVRPIRASARKAATGVS